MELTNSKRLRYRASYVSPRFTPTEQCTIEARARGGTEKAFAIRSLGLDSNDVERMRAETDLHSDGTETRENYQLWSVAERIARNPSVTSMKLAAKLAPISYDALLAFVNHSSLMKYIEENAQDYFESYCERGVNEKSEASTSSENESRQSNGLNFGAITSGT